MTQAKHERMYAPANVASTNIAGYEYTPADDRSVDPIHADHVQQLRAQGYRTHAELERARAPFAAEARPAKASEPAPYSTGPYPRLLAYVRANGVDCADDVADAALLRALEGMAPPASVIDAASADIAARASGPQEGQGAASEGAGSGGKADAADAASASAGAADDGKGAAGAQVEPAEIPADGQGGGPEATEASTGSGGSTFTQPSGHTGPVAFELLPRTTGGDPSFGQWEPGDIRRWLTDQGVATANNATKAKLVEIAGSTLADLKAAGR